MTSNEQACEITCFPCDVAMAVVCLPLLYSCVCLCCNVNIHTWVSLLQYDAVNRDVAKCTLLLFYSIPWLSSNSTIYRRVFDDYLHIYVYFMCSMCACAFVAHLFCSFHLLFSICHADALEIFSLTKINFWYFGIRQNMKRSRQKYIVKLDSQNRF